jgi:TonB family protein
MHPLPITLAYVNLASPNLDSLHLESFLLTYAINALWQVPLIFAAAWIAARASRRAGAAFHHALWTAALFAEVLLPACSAQLFQTALHWLASFRHTNVPQTAHVTVTMGTPHAAPSFHFPPALLAIAALLYLAALTFFAIRLAVGLHQTASLRRRAQPLDLAGHARQSYNRYAQLFAVPHALVATSTEIASPITLGIRHPTLLLPMHLDSTLLPEDLDAVLAHEFAHMRRRDFAKNLLYQLLSLPIAFHPILWLTRARMAETRELVCDDLAASAVAGRQRYARSLLRLATQFAHHPHAAPAPHAIGIFDAHPFKNFERRVMNLTHHSIELRGAARYATAALSLALIGGACTTALAFRQQVVAPQPQTTTAPSTVNIGPAPSDIGPSNVKVSAAPAGPGPTTVVLAVPRPTVGQPATSVKVDIADASSPNPVVKVLTNVVIDPIHTNIHTNVHTDIKTNTQTSTQTNTVTALHIGAGDMAGNRNTFVEPVYPDAAKKAKLDGTVVLDAVIGKDGKIEKLQVISTTDPMFSTSALDAVRQWTYKPYLLNGDPTKVETTITVNYALSK